VRVLARSSSALPFFDCVLFFYSSAGADPFRSEFMYRHLKHVLIKTVKVSEVCDYGLA
jgi:hypothetical protein